MSKFASSLSSDLRGRYGRRNLRPVTGDSVKIVRGSFKGIEGKVTRVDSSLGKVYVEGVNREKIAGGKTSGVPIDASKVQITNLNLDDKLRRQRITRETETAPAATPAAAEEGEAQVEVTSKPKRSRSSTKKKKKNKNNEAEAPAKKSSKKPSGRATETREEETKKKEEKE